MKTNKYFVIGNPIEHSKSPLIHNFWIKKYSINATYEKLKVEESEIKNLIDKVRKGKVQGFNVTIPYKKKMLSFVDELDQSAVKSNAINTVYKSGNKIVGCNTDGVGFVSSLVSDLNYEIKPKSNIFFIGSGGAAYGIIASLVELNPKMIEITNRTRSSVEKLISHFEGFVPKGTLILKAWGESPGKETNLVINSSACGMNKGDSFNLNFQSLSSESLVYDIIYNPRKTILMKKAETEKIKSSNGIYMLVRQAAESFRKWFNISLKNSDINDVVKLIGKRI